MFNRCFTKHIAGLQVISPYEYVRLFTCLLLRTVLIVESVESWMKLPQPLKPLIFIQKAGVQNRSVTGSRPSPFSL